MRIKKSQIQMAETIGILFIFIVLVALGVTFWFKIKSSSISQKTVELQELQAVEVVQLLSNLPELQCTRLNEVEDNCFDEKKIIAFSKYLRGCDTDACTTVDADDAYDRTMQYYPMLRLSKVEVEIIYPFFWDDEDYDGVPDLVEENLFDGDLGPVIYQTPSDYQCAGDDGSNVIISRALNKTDPLKPLESFHMVQNYDCANGLTNSDTDVVDEVDKYNDTNGDGKWGSCSYPPVTDPNWECEPDKIRPEWPDQDDDGILDAWELEACSLPAHDFTDDLCISNTFGYDDPDRNGYTFWEEYVNGVMPGEITPDMRTATNILIYNLTFLKTAEAQQESYSASATTVPVTIKDPVRNIYKFAKLHITTYRQ